MPPKINLEQLERFYPPDRQTWRAWLNEHHADKPGVWLIYYKKHTGQPSVTYDESVEEALCFGWIDSKPNVLDEDRYMLLFSPRKPKSPWSQLNKQRIEALIAQGLMTPAGLEKIESAKKDGSWNTYDNVEDLTVPDDLAQALAANPTAQGYFEAFPPSSKKIILWWIASAKKPETRAKRIEETVRLAAINKRANHFREK
jgi:uncharacterized protein YdeI (YjbR/CyaY-like superfamily)